MVHRNDQQPHAHRSLLRNAYEMQPTRLHQRLDDHHVRNGGSVPPKHYVRHLDVRHLDVATVLCDLVPHL